MPKQVNIPDALLDKYSDKDLVNYCTTRLKQVIATAIKSSNGGASSDMILGQLFQEISFINSVLVIANNKLNDIDNSPNIAI